MTEWEEQGMSKEEYEQAMEDHMNTVSSTSRTNPIVGMAIKTLFEYGKLHIPTKNEIQEMRKSRNTPPKNIIIYSFQSSIDEELQKHLLNAVIEALDTPRYEGKYIINNNVITLVGYEDVKQ